MKKILFVNAVAGVAMAGTIIVMAGFAAVANAQDVAGGCLSGQAACQASNASCPNAPGETTDGCMSPWGCVPDTASGFAGYPACTAPAASTPPPTTTGPGSTTGGGTTTIIGATSTPAGTFAAGPTGPGQCVTIGQGTIAVCNGTNPNDANGVSTSTLQKSEAACFQGTETVSNNPGTYAQGTCQATLNGQITPINYCLGDETNGPCAADRIDPAAAAAAALAQQNIDNGSMFNANETCHAQYNGLPTIDPNTGLNYFYDTVCTTNAGSSSGGSGTKTTGTTGSSGSGAGLGSATGATGSTGSGGSINYSTLFGNLENTIQTFLSSNNNLNQISNLTPVTGSGSAGTSVGSTQTLLTSLQQSLQIIQSSLNTNQGALSAGTLSSVNGVLASITQLIHTLAAPNQ